MLVDLCTVSDCFHTTLAELSIWDKRPRGLQNLKHFPYGSLQKKFVDCIGFLLLL